MNRPEWPDAGGWRSQFPQLPKVKVTFVVAIAILVAGVFLPGPGIVLGVALGVLFDMAVRADWPDEEPDPYWLRKWVMGAHEAHAPIPRHARFIDRISPDGSVTWHDSWGVPYVSLSECTEPECEEGRVWLDRIHQAELKEWKKR